MTRGNDPGRDFDNQYHQSRRAGQEKADRGASHWSADKYAKDAGKLVQPPGDGPKHAADSCSFILALLGGLVFILGALAYRVVA